MQFESQWPGDATAAPACTFYSRDDAVYVGHPGEFGVPRGSGKRQAFDEDNNDREGHRSGDPTSCIPQPSAGILAGWRARIVSIASIPVGLWRAMLFKSESRRMRAAWEALDDRTLRDIGISRCEIEHATHGRRWS
jgi:uncharacterized protein YjiS (DUF1127 family)